MNWTNEQITNFGEKNTNDWKIKKKDQISPLFPFLPPFSSLTPLSLSLSSSLPSL